MPYIAIKSFPKDEEIVGKVIDKINQLFLEEWGCPPQAISISYEEVPKEEWKEKVADKEMAERADAMRILHGEKQ